MGLDFNIADVRVRNLLSFPGILPFKCVQFEKNQYGCVPTLLFTLGFCRAGFHLGISESP